MPYEPTPSDIAWAEEFLSLTKNNAVWTAPRFGTYRIDHEKKQLVLVDSWGPEVFFEMDKAVFGAAGYEVVKDVD